MTKQSLNNSGIARPMDEGTSSRADLIEYYEIRFDREQLRNDIEVGRRNTTPKSRDQNSRTRIEAPIVLGDQEINLDTNLTVEAQKAASREKAAARKSAQLCTQVEHEVLAAISEADAYEQMIGYTVQEVVPRAGSSTLNIVIRQIQKDTPSNVAEAENWLMSKSSLIRESISRIISRSRTPDICFVVLPFNAVKIES